MYNKYIHFLSRFESLSMLNWLGFDRLSTHFFLSSSLDATQNDMKLIRKNTIFFGLLHVFGFIHSTHIGVDLYLNYRVDNIDNLTVH